MEAHYQVAHAGTDGFVPASGAAYESLIHQPILAELPIGGRLILRCRADWRDATVVAVSPDQVTLSVGSPNGRTYRVRRPAHTALFLDGQIPVLGEGPWRAGMVRYDARW
ncbi:MAG: hypothetical protein WKF84_22510 [Pyrinomonadaceae bacterium]